MFALKALIASMLLRLLSCSTDSSATRTFVIP